MRWALWFVPILLAGLACAAPPAVRIQRAEHPPALEEYLGEEAPAGAAVTGFTQLEPSEGSPASQTTLVYLSYDSHSLYIVFRCHDREPDKIRARLSKRDDLLPDDDFVAVRLDTFHDRRRAFEFLVNPLGVQVDALFDESSGRDTTFDTLWYSEGRLTSWGYAVRIAIPLKSLRFSSQTRQTWGILLIRRIPRASEYSYWPAVTRKIAGYMTQAGDLEGLEGISPGRNIQLIPYATFLSSHYADLQAQRFREKRQPDGGLDAKVVLHDKLALDLTLNPDFSEVESDEPQVTVNQRFEVFFPEKRPFFLENSNYFQTPIQVFFTRRIVHPQFGARLTGKQGPWAIGALIADDRAPGEVAGPAVEGRRAGFEFFRLSRDVAAESTVGAVFAERRFAGTWNRVAGFDTRVKLPRQFIFTGQALTSFTRDSAGKTRGAPGFLAGVERHSRHWQFQDSYTDFSPNFRTDAGFVPRVDIREAKGSLGYSFWPDRGSLYAWGPDFSYDVIWNHAGERQDWRWQAGMGWTWRRQTYLWVGTGLAHERYLGRDFDRRGQLLQFNIAASKRWSFYTYTSYGRDIVYQPAAGRAPFQASGITSQNTIGFRPLARLRLDHTILLTHLRQFGNGAPVFTNAIFRQKANLQFNRRLSLRTIVQYDGTVPNAASSGLDRTKRFAGDVLLSYVLHPGTAFYFGYNHQLDNIDAALGARPDVPFRTPALFPTSRQFFAKISYLYRF
jgi:hypothetical protein